MTERQQSHTDRGYRCECGWEADPAVAPPKTYVQAQSHKTNHPTHHVTNPWGEEVDTLLAKLKRLAGVGCRG